MTTQSSSRPRLTVDIIITRPGHTRRVILIKRRNPPHGWAIPGGFVEAGETVELAAVREAEEETGLRVSLERQFHVYSDPARDPRGHTVSVVFVAVAEGEPAAATDAAEARFFDADRLPEEIAFDHSSILNDFFGKKY